MTAPTTVVDPVRVLGDRTDNATAIADCARLGYLRPEWITLDVTWGQGRFWRQWQPTDLLASDLELGGRWDGCQWVESWDFTALPATVEVDVIVFDPPYKLNGTSQGRGGATCDEGYGVHRRASRQDRFGLILAGIRECARHTRQVLLVKCQDQVEGGRKRWMTHECVDAAVDAGLVWIDQLHVQSYRPQPMWTPCSTCHGTGADFSIEFDRPPHFDRCKACGGAKGKARTQRHAHQDYSTLLVFAVDGGVLA